MVSPVFFGRFPRSSLSLSRPRPLPTLSPFLIGHLASVDVKQHESAESRQDQEEGGELDSNKEASPEEIKSREMVLGLDLDFFCFSCLPAAELRALSLWLCSA